MASVPEESTTTEAAAEAAPLPPPLAALPEDAVLGGQYVVKSCLLRRGWLNVYRATTDDYLQPQSFLVLERAEAEQTEAEEDLTLTAPLFPRPVASFASSGKHYLVFSFMEATAEAAEQATPLSLTRRLPNDAKVCGALADLGEGLAELVSLGRELIVPGDDELWDQLWLNGADRLRHFGFLGTSESQSAADSALEVLLRVARRLLVHSFANESTLPLGPTYEGLPYAEEVCTLVQQLEDRAISLEEALAEVRRLSPDVALTFDCASASDTGLERSLNEDSVLVLSRVRVGVERPGAFDLLAVADGMGGHEGGERASALALDVLEQAAMDPKTSDGEAVNFEDNVAVRRWLLEVLDRINEAVTDFANGQEFERAAFKPGTTLVFVLRLGRRLFIAHVGDSRAYLHREGQLMRVTKDHSYVQSLVDSGDITEEQAFTHPDRNQILAHIGMRGLRVKGLKQRYLLAGDRWLLCSDGLNDMLRDPEIAAILAFEAEKDLVCRALIDAANEGGGNDNISVALLSARTGEPTPAAPADGAAPVEAEAADPIHEEEDETWQTPSPSAPLWTRIFGRSKEIS